MHATFKKIIMTGAVLTLLGAGSAAFADNNNPSMGSASNMDMKNMPMQDAKSTKSESHQRTDLKNDKKCLDKHGKLMGKPGVKNGVKCRQTHGYQMKHKQHKDKPAN